MFNFFNPENVIKTFLLEEFGHNHNPESENGQKLQNKINNLRKSIKKHFSAKKFEIVFFPNIVILKNLVFKFLKEQKTKLKEKNIKNNLEFEKILNFKNQNIFLSINFKNEIPNDKHLSKFLKNNPNSLIYLNLDSLLYEDLEKLIENSHFFSFAPNYSLNLFGTIIFGYKNFFKLKPEFVGSNSVKFDHENNFIFLDTPNSLECGTQNFPNLLLLERYFYFLNKKKQEINNLLEISSKKLKLNKNFINFNIFY